MKRFKQSGFGVTVALVTATFAGVISTDAAIRLIGIYNSGRLYCGNGIVTIWNQFPFALLLIVFAVTGWQIARTSRYGSVVARCAVVGAVTAWFIAFAATHCR